MASKITLVESAYGLKASLESEWTPDTAAYLASYNVVELELNVAKGWTERAGISFLSELTFLKSFELFNFGIKDISPIHALGNLRRLGITTYCSSTIDFSKFPFLESCSLEWRPKATSLFDCTTLRELFVNRYKGKDTRAFSNLVNLESLQLLNAPVTNLRGLRTLARLRELRLARLTQLMSLEGIEVLTALENLTVSTCRKITSVEKIEPLTNLRNLDLDNDGDIASLRPLERLNELERIGFDTSTNILDGDMTVLIGLPKLKRVAFQNRKHYTHTREELNAIFAKRNGAGK